MYQKQGVKVESIMKKGGWTDHKSMQRYLEYNNRCQEMEFEYALARDQNHTLQRCRIQDRILFEIANILQRPTDPNLTAEQLRAQILACWKL